MSIKNPNQALHQVAQSLVPDGLSSELIRTYDALGDQFHGLRGFPMPSESEIHQVLHDLRDILFPGISTGFRPKGAELRAFVDAKVHDAALRLRRQLCFGQQFIRTSDGDRECAECEGCSDNIIRDFLNQLPEIRRMLTKDALAAMSGDPAVRNMGEVLFSYPGFYAVSVYRVANALYRLNAPIVPRMMTELAHHATGIDIHPGATIGESFFIDHGTGVVIGETSLIGTGVRIYQGVTLGAMSLSQKRVNELRGGAKRHPTIEDDVVIYAGATILGGNTVIGKGSVIGGNSWVVESVPPGSRVSIQVASDIRLPKDENGAT